MSLFSQKANLNVFKTVQLPSIYSIPHPSPIHRKIYLPFAFPFLSFGNSNGTFKLAFFIFAASVTVSAIPAATSFSLSVAEGTMS